jgi:hypothetical protein
MDLDGVGAAFLDPSVSLLAGAVRSTGSPPRCAVPITAG